MARNGYGFVCKRYRQPKYYREIFGRYNAMYTTDNGKDIMIEAVPSFLVSNPIGKEISYYNILIQEKDCRKTLMSRIKTQKAVFEFLDRFIKKY